jgi:hypothetical protein
MQSQAVLAVLARSARSARLRAVRRQSAPQLCIPLRAPVVGRGPTSGSAGITKERNNASNL